MDFIRKSCSPVTTRVSEPSEPIWSVNFSLPNPNKPSINWTPTMMANWFRKNLRNPHGTACIPQTPTTTARLHWMNFWPGDADVNEPSKNLTRQTSSLNWIKTKMGS